MGSEKVVGLPHPFPTREGVIMPDTPEQSENETLRNLLLRLPPLSDRELTIEPLKGGMTNHNFVVRANGESYVVRVAGAGTGLLGIDRNQEAACARAAADAGVAPEVVASLHEPAVLVTRFTPGRVLTTAALREPKTLERVARALRRCHDYAMPLEAASFSPFASARRCYSLAKERHVPMPPEMDHAVAMLDHIEREVQTEEAPCLCHNDVLPANLIEDDHRVWIIDWVFAGRGDRFFDLGALAANAEFTTEQEELLIAAYFGEFRRPELRRLKLMRLASDVREATWGYLQSAISDLHESDYYLDYGHRHLARFLAESESAAARHERRAAP
jgi:thiamine kinase-like enzyme